ncbi:MAG: hypothetical protein HYV07_04610 [Deltaproteobacteria bacterium]|nr:hypothetical protein [Deltaproteobacteria bacterium]
MGTKKSNPSLDFIVYAGDPDSASSEKLSSRDVIDQFDRVKDRLSLDDLYGAILLEKAGKRLIEPLAEPLVGLLTKCVRCLPYVLEGEPETVLLSESEHGFLFEPANDDLQISFFRGNDAFDPDEYLVEKASLPLMDFGEQLVGMCDRMVELIKKHDAKRLETDDLAKGLVEMLETGRAAFKRSRLEKERGLSGRR